jgi:hypothetical protein
LSGGGGGGGGGGGVSTSDFQPFINDGRVVATSSVITISVAVYRSNNVVTALSTVGTVQANAGSLAAGSQVWLEFDPITKARFLVSNANVTQAGLGVSNVLLGIANASGFTPGRIPIATCTGGSPANTWMTCTDARTPFVTQVLTAGQGIVIAPADALGTQQISATSNPRVYKTLANGASSCPSAESTLESYQFPVGTNVAAGDSIDIVVWFQKTGSSTPAIAVRVDGTYGNDPGNLGVLSMGSAVYAIRMRAIVLSSSSIAYDFDVRRDTGSTVLAGSPVFTGVTVTGTPLVEFRASGCIGGDSIRVLGAVITLAKGASL